MKLLGAPAHWILYAGNSFGCIVIITNKIMILICFHSDLILQSLLYRLSCENMTMQFQYATQTVQKDEFHIPADSPMGKFWENVGAFIK